MTSPRRRKWNPVSVSTTIGSRAGKPLTGSRQEELAGERPDRQLDAERRAHLRRARSARDDDTSASSSSARDPLAELDAELDRSADELARRRRRVGDAVRRAERRTEHIVDARGRARARRELSLALELLDRHAELALDVAPLRERRPPRLGRGEEEVADLVEERRPELLEEPDALPGE